MTRYLIPKPAREYLPQSEGWMPRWDLDFLYENATHISEDLGPLLEVGSYRGLSASALTLAGMTFCVDSWMNDPESGTMVDYFPDFETNMRNTGRWNQVVVLRGDSRHILPYLRDNSFRLVLVDANHTYDYVRSDLKESMRILHPGGMLVIDDIQNTSTPDVYRAATDLEFNVIFVKRSKLGYLVKEV